MPAGLSSPVTIPALDVNSVGWIGRAAGMPLFIQEGERRPSGRYEVLKKCGEPTTKQGNAWTYERGGTAKVVTFNDSGQIASIRKY